MKIRVTAEDIEGSVRFEINNPLIHALQRTTGTLWLLSDCGLAVEAITPYRTFILPEEIMAIWREFKSTGYMPCCEFEVEAQNLQKVS